MQVVVFEDVIWGWGLGTAHEADGDIVDESKRGHGDGLREVLGEGEGVAVGGVGGFGGGRGRG